jgi:beta-carotene 3-hydroxylase
MLIFITNIFAVFFAFAAMEMVAWLAHKFVMHGLLWSWHKDHHEVDPESTLEKNDLFFILFATPGISLILYGSSSFNVFFWLGLGIALYGLCYFLVHDVFIHRRLPIFKNTEFSYFKAIRKAHKIHHKSRGRLNGKCFGMLWVPLKYHKETR